VPSEVFVHPPVYPGGTLINTVLSVQPRIFALYLVNLFCPLWLCADYSSYSVRDLPLGLSWPLILLVAAGFVWMAMKDRRAALAVALIVAALLPVANLVPLFRAAADRFLYVPLIGAGLLVALALDARWIQQTRRRRLATGALVAILALLFPVTLQRERAWSSALDLWQDTLARNPQSVTAWVGLPEALQEANRWPEAKAASEKAIRTPAASWPWIWFDYAVELEKLGDHAGAERAARRAIALKPDIVDGPKMERTLQQSPEMMQAFAPIAARLSAQR
jgi:tetratricopeptide (TPR) repeat protein